MIELKKISEMNISGKMKLKIINKEINESRKKYIQRLKIEDPESYSVLRKSQKKDLKRFRKMNPDYQKNWVKKQSRGNKSGDKLK